MADDLRGRLRAEIQRRREIAEKATPGPWSWHEQHGRDATDEGWSHVWVDASRSETRRGQRPCTVATTYYADDEDAAEDPQADAAHIAANDPTTVLRRLAADDRILDLHEHNSFPGSTAGGIAQDPALWCETCGEIGAEPGWEDCGPWCATLLAMADGYGIGEPDGP